jgi:hypothetical protein
MVGYRALSMWCRREWCWLGCWLGEGFFLGFFWVEVIFWGFFLGGELLIVEEWRRKT